MTKLKKNRASTRISRLLNLVVIFAIIAAVTYGFMSLCYWSLNLQEWQGFGRFLLGAEAVIFLFKAIDEV